MKNKIKFGTTAIIAIIALSFTACNKDSGINTEIIFRSQQPPANLNMSIARSAMGGTTTDNTFDGMNEFYTAMGTPDAAYTPSVFQLRDGGIMVMANGSLENLTDSTLEIIDFVQGTTITPFSDIPAGINATAMLVRFDLYMYDTQYAPAMTTFTINEPLHASHPYRTWPANFVTGRYDITVSADGKTITMPTIWLFPDNTGDYPSLGGSENDILNGIADFPIAPDLLYYGTVYRAKNLGIGSNNAETGGLGTNTPGAIIIPWAGVSIPSNASGITFNVQFNITNIIEQYGTGEDMRFVLANEFWNRYSLTADIN
ncbi:MAG: hypothetical protein FWB95_08850 [Treponema sp.]|nr:hypothetical protein [Treponema sp.]